MANTKITTAVIKDDAVTSAKIADDLALGGNPTTTTQSAGNNTTRIATTAFVTTAVSNLVDSAPSALDTLNELAAALGDDASFSTTVTNSIATKLPLAGGTLTGDLIITSATSGKPVLNLTNTNADASPPQLNFKKDSASPADNDEVGRIYMYGDDDAGNATEAFLAIGKMTDVTNGSEDSSLAMYTYNDGAQTLTLTLDSGNVLVGRSSVGSTGAGHSIRGADSAIFSRDNGEAIITNRGSSNGKLIELRKDGTEFANIQVLNNNNLAIMGSVADHGGIQFGTHSMVPMEAGVDADGTVDLGSSSARWKDLYLSGVSDAANYKISGAQGNDGQVLTSTGSGVAWEDASGGVTSFNANGLGSNRYYAGLIRTEAGSDRTLDTTTIYYLPFIVFEDGQIDGVNIIINGGTGNAGDLAQIAIYGPVPDNLSNVPKLVTSPTFAVNSGYAKNVAITSTTVTAGVYLYSITANTASLSIRQYENQTHFMNYMVGVSNSGFIGGCQSVQYSQNTVSTFPHSYPSTVNADQANHTTIAYQFKYLVV